MTDMAYIGRNLARTEAELSAAAARGGYPTPTLVAVTKSASDDQVLALCEAGARHIAENRVQNFMARRALLSAHGYAPAMHLIGSLQTNKVKYLLPGVSLIQSLDSVRLADEIEKRAAGAGIVLPVLCEVNIGREVAKGGLMPEEVSEFCRLLRGGAYAHLSLSGLMTMAPAAEEEEAYRPYFRQMRRMFEELCRAGMFAGQGILSMGMSDSYRVAAEEGATMVRVGRGLFKQDF